MTKQNEFENAVDKNNFTKVKELISHPEVNFKDKNNQALGVASAKGYIKIATLLLKDKDNDLSSIENYPICISVQNEHIEIVRLLLNDERNNPTEDRNYSIRMAYMRNNFKIIKLLLSDIRVKNTLKNDDLALYNKIISLEIQKKIKEF
jgi:ankyrin repeat protein